MGIQASNAGQDVDTQALEAAIKEEINIISPPVSIATLYRLAYPLA
jgi:hypothetical protein